MPLTSGTRLGRYEVQGQLGVGGMGEVYVARDTQLDRTIALKILRSDVASDTQWLRRFVQEAKAASSLNHPNILTIHEIGQSDSTHFIATELIEGETLRARMTKARLKLTDALDVAIQVASALAAAHAVGLVAARSGFFYASSNSVRFCDLAFGGRWRRWGRTLMSCARRDERR